MGKLQKKCWVEIPKHHQNVQLDEYVVMPNHIHGIVVINEPAVEAIHELPLRNKLPHSREQRRKMLLPKIIGRFKMNVAKQINKIRQTPGISVWQRNYYEHIVRNETDLQRIREYIVNNPLNWEMDENYV